MDTPICDFLTEYHSSGTARFHMPGHKGVPFLGCEPLDITEISGADSLYEADGIIAQSEQNATALFDSGKTVYSTEGSSQCIRAMLYLALTHRKEGTPPVIVAARNVHKAFVYAAALLDFQVVWLWQEGDCSSICGCPVSADMLDRTLGSLESPPAAVYITSPDYLGGMADIGALAQVCHRHGTLLAVDNAHGAYLHFLPQPRHPLDLGADLCCDSAHKTLPVLTGGAYLHLSSRISGAMASDIKSAMALFGSTSPSYLTLASLDRCNRYLAQEYPTRLDRSVRELDAVRRTLRDNGWRVLPSDPLRITIQAPSDQTGIALGERLRRSGIECEYADPEFLVLMLTPENTPEELALLTCVLGKNRGKDLPLPTLPQARGVKTVSIREALFSPHESIPASQSLGRICGAPTVSCPPAIPIAVSGEQIGEAALELFAHYSIEYVDVLK